MKKKRNIVVASAIGLIAIVGGTIAYNSNTALFNNLFHLGGFNGEATEYFESPDDWAPCEEVEKKVFASNPNDQPIAVRIAYESYWKMKENPSAGTTTDLPLQVNNKDVAEVHLINEDEWILEDDGYYYYKYLLQPGESTPYFMDYVMLDCGISFAEDCDEETAAILGDECDSSDYTDYQNAVFHVKVRVQTNVSPTESGWGYIAGSTNDYKYLYNAIADQTNGSDSGIDFSSTATLDGENKVNGYGVNTVASTVGQSFPVYYFRGDVDNNFVLWNNICWRVLRTTDTGGVKLIYVNAINEDTPSCVESTSYGAVNTAFSASSSSGSGNEIQGAGYMYGASWETMMDYDGSSKGRTYGKRISWNGSRYKIEDLAYNNATLSELEDGYYYYCPPDGVATTCSEARFAVYANGGNTTWALRLTNGDTLESMKAKVFSNVHDSLAKTALDNWAETTIAAKEDDLEDTIFCNDRSITEDSTLYAEGVSPGFLGARFGGHERLFNLAQRKYDAHAPSLDCPNKRDAFTKSRFSRGNGKLKYKVGMVTADEIAYSRATYYAPYSLTMSPAGFVIGGTFGAWGESHIISQYQGRLEDDNSTIRRSISPVVSLKAYTRYTVGTEGTPGTASNPYIVE